MDDFDLLQFLLQFEGAAPAPEMDSKLIFRYTPAIR
jgi:hypothetical protein